MPSLLPGYEYDIFISYRQNDNRSGWVRQFVEDLREELGATIKEPVNIYFDENPHDGLQDTHHVDKSLEGKLKCLIFVPILSRTYCDPKSFAWNHEFLPFLQFSKNDAFGLHVRLPSGNFASRVLPVQIHDLDSKDLQLYEQETGDVVRSVDFIFRSPGVSRPLTHEDSRADNLTKTLYRDQINKAANALREILYSFQSVNQEDQQLSGQSSNRESAPRGIPWIWEELLRRNVLRAAATYIIVALLILQVMAVLSPLLHFSEWIILATTKVLVVGFPVAMTLAWLFEISPQGFIRTTSPHSYSNPFPPSRKKPLTSPTMVFVLGLSLALLLIYIILFVTPNPKAEQPTITLGIIPFENRSENPDDRYIARSLTDDIVNRLIVVSQFRVTDGTSLYDKNLAAAGILEIANRLKTSFILTGSVQRSGDQFVVRCRLYDVASSKYIWSEIYNLNSLELVGVQSEIALTIADELGVDLSDTEELRLLTQATNDPTAYDYYLKGKNLYLKYKRASNDSAVIMFRHAIEKDQNYARAWAGLGDAYSQMYRFGYEESWNDSSMKASLKAIQLDSNLSEAYKSLANAYNAKRLYDKSLPYLLKALELNPRNESAVGNLGTNYFFRGDMPEALRLQKKSAAINPKKFVPYYIAGWIYCRLGDYKNAELWLKESLALDSTFAQTYELLAYAYVAEGRKNDALALIPHLLKDEVSHKNLEKAGIIAQFCGDLDRAKKYYQEAISKNENFSSDPVAISPIGLGQILLKEGGAVKAGVLLSHTLELNLQEVNRGSQDDDPPFMIAAVYAILDKKTESLEWLQKAINANWLDYDQIAHNPWFENIRQEPGYLKIMKDLRKRLDTMRKKAEGL